MKLSDIIGYVTSGALALLVIFTYGSNPTGDAVLVTLVWLLFGIAAFAIGSMTVVLYAVRSSGKKYDSEFAGFYEGLSKLHGNIAKRIIGYAFVGLWLYALILHQWTVTAVFYVVLTVYMQLFLLFTKDLKKDYFHGRLKGEEMAK